MIGNHWTSAGTALDRALEFEDGAEPSQVYSSGNRFPGAEIDNGRAAGPFPRTDSVAVVGQNRIVEDVIPFVGHPSRTPEEEGLIAEIIDAVRSGN